MYIYNEVNKCIHIISKMQKISINFKILKKDGICNQPTNKLKIRILSQTSIFYKIRHSLVILFVNLHL